MNVNPSERRGTVFSAFTLCDDLGKGLGPSIATRPHGTTNRYLHIRQALLRLAAPVLRLLPWFLFLGDGKPLQWPLQHGGSASSQHCRSLNLHTGYAARVGCLG